VAAFLILGGFQMAELFIMVKYPGMSDTTYSFDKFPVRIGRSETCHLSICHQAIARELCTAWIEPDGRTVRVEERPRLTNPLLSGKTRVTGGISGGVLDLSVGPCKLSFYSKKNNPKTGYRKKRLAILLALVVVVLFVSGLGKRDRGSSHPGVVASLPKTPFCAVRAEECTSPAVCSERARLLLGRAREMLSRPNIDRAERIRAAGMMRSAVGLYGRVSPHLSDTVQQEVADIEHQLTQQYQQDIVGLKRALDVNDLETAHETAHRIYQDIEGCNSEAAEALARLIAITQKEEPSS
jgi:HPt (histidine-containing phosphotransfer) domain-containing protein